MNSWLRDVGRLLYGGDWETHRPLRSLLPKAMFGLAAITVAVLITAAQIGPDAVRDSWDLRLAVGAAAAATPADLAAGLIASILPPRRLPKRWFAHVIAVMISAAAAVSFVAVTGLLSYVWAPADDIILVSAIGSVVVAILVLFVSEHLARQEDGAEGAVPDIELPPE